MFFLYSLLLTVGFVLLSPRFLYDAARKGKYAAGFGQRLGWLPDFAKGTKPLVWLHAVSVGEVQAARPIVREILENFPEYQLVVSTTTNTGQKLAREIFADDARLIFYFPFDWKFSVRRALRKIKPDLVLLMETELWFNFIREASKSGARVAVVNGRLSEKSARRYGWIRGVVSRVLHYLDLALVQTGADARRFISLGIRNAKVKITGNVKFDQISGEAESELTEDFRRRFDISEEAPLIVAASTHAPEERFILDAFKTVYKTTAGRLPRLLIAPRHPERFSEVAETIKRTGFQWTRRSENASARDRAAEIILLDSIGELRAVYPLAEIVFVGGSLIPHGGQSILEPAAAGKAIVTGFHTMNFKAALEEFRAQNALVQLSEIEEKEIPAKLAETFDELLQNDVRRRELAENAGRVMRENRGAAAKTVEYLKPIFEAKNRKLATEGTENTEKERKNSTADERG